MVRRVVHHYIYVVLALLLFPGSPLAGQEGPKREFRAVWISTVLHLDYPRQPTTDTVALRENYRQLLRRFRDLGLNAVIFQVRPAADAFYPTTLAPWSAYLTGKQGLAPKGNFDPLRFYVEETHRFGMEFHAWFNPYRATTNLDTAKLAPSHVFFQHRDWLVRYGNRFYFNPALPAVRKHLTEIVAEVVSRYDIDAIHFDDYFYPYKIAGETFPDSLDFRRYGYQYTSIDDWRRSNVDVLIAELASTIRRIKPYVRFGISPFGVWRNQDRDPQGSPTRAGVTCYDDLYADVLKWTQRGWIDYVVPQLYWNIGFAPADHAVLLDWWGHHTNGGKHLYIGHAAYKVGDNPETAWDNPGEIPRQISLNRSSRLSAGSVFFRSKYLFFNPLGLSDSLRTLYRHPALLPAFEGPAEETANAPRLQQARRKKDTVRLKWKANRHDRRQLPAYYVVYRFYGTASQNFDDPANILAITEINGRHKRYQFVDKKVDPNQKYAYAVTAVNRYHRESQPSEMKKVK